MIGTEDGLWFALKDAGFGRISYEFYQYDDLERTGVAENEDELWTAFDDFVKSKRH